MTKSHTRCLGLLTGAAAILVTGISLAQEKPFEQTATIAPSTVRGAKQAGQLTGGKTAAKRDGAKRADPFAGGPAVQWIWGATADKNYHLRKTFTVKGPVKVARLIAACDNTMVVTLNGKRVATGSDWGQAKRVTVTDAIKQGENELLVDAGNSGGPAGLALKLVINHSGGGRSRHIVVSGNTWQAREGADGKWAAVKTVGKMGGQPWGNVFSKPSFVSTTAAQRDKFQLLPGFQVELLYTVPKGQQGSWVSITVDPKGRLIASDQGNKGLYRITPPPVGVKDGKTKVEKLDLNITSAQGLLCAFDSLYISVNGGPGSGFYRARDTNGDDQYDELVKLKALQGGGEHGPHAIRLAPDGKSLYVIAGNHTNPPQQFNASRVPSNWSEDLLLARQWDARGHARGKLAPGGWIARTDPNGKTWEIVSIGYRNPYDMDFNADGELFAYDADMEWDMGSPWYRPTRVMHAASGSEFGWRSGTGKWPNYFVDSLPAAVDIGPGSPVGVTFGYGTKFPAKYQKALYILDWTFGTMYAIHIKPQGASYTATKEEFVARTPLPLTDAVVGHDGALYFTVGGRGAQSELFRVTYVGDAVTTKVDARDSEFADLRDKRRQLEAYHQPVAKEDLNEAVGEMIEALSHTDRHIRYAARVGLEHQPVGAWQDKALAATHPDAVIQAAVALARQGKAELQPRIIKSLEQVEFAKLDDRQKLDWLRALALVGIRHGRPPQDTCSRLAAGLDEFFPGKNAALNRELCRVLVYLESPTVIGKTLKLLDEKSETETDNLAQLLSRNPRYGGAIAKMLENHPDLQKLHYAFVLRNMRYGWTLEQRKRYLNWLDQAQSKSGGASYVGFIKNTRTDALANASESERKLLASQAPPPPVPTATLPKAIGPGKEWTLDDLTQLTSGGLRGRNFERGKRTYAAARCVVCHRFDGAGGATGPDLTNVAGRFSFRDLGESLVDPSKVVSDQYRASIVETAKGKVHTGRVVEGANGAITVLIDPEDGTKVVELKKDDIEDIRPSPISLMPKDLLNTLNRDEVLDLLAYLMSRGNPQDLMFR